MRKITNLLAVLAFVAALISCTPGANSRVKEIGDAACLAIESGQTVAGNGTAARTARDFSLSLAEMYNNLYADEKFQAEVFSQISTAESDTITEDTSKYGYDYGAVTFTQDVTDLGDDVLISLISMSFEKDGEILGIDVRNPKISSSSTSASMSMDLSYTDTAEYPDGALISFSYSFHGQYSGSYTLALTDIRYKGETVNSKDAEAVTAYVESSISFSDSDPDSGEVLGPNEALLQSATAVLFSNLTPNLPEAELSWDINDIVLDGYVSGEYKLSADDIDVNIFPGNSLNSYYMQMNTTGISITNDKGIAGQLQIPTSVYFANLTIYPDTRKILWGTHFFDVSDDLNLSEEQVKEILTPLAFDIADIVFKQSSKAGITYGETAERRQYYHSGILTFEDMTFNVVELTINRRSNGETPSNIDISTNNVLDANRNYLLSAIDFTAYFTETDGDIELTYTRLSEGESSTPFEANSSVIEAAESFLSSVLN